MDATTSGHEEGWLWRIVSVVVGFGVTTTGWALIMTAILSFIGIPLFILGLALRCSAHAERGAEIGPADGDEGARSRGSSPG